MKLTLCAIWLALLSIGTAHAQGKLIISKGLSAQHGRAAVKNTPFVTGGLYLVRLECHPYTLAANDNNNHYYPSNPFVDETRQMAFTLTLSNARIGTNEVPPPTSILTVAPVVADTLSKVAPQTTKNGACNQALLVTGRTPLYLTALYTDQVSEKPSELVSAIEAFASLVAPLAGFFTGGVSNLLKGDTSVVSSMTTPYANLLGTLNFSGSQTDTEPLEQGYYLIKSPVGVVAVSVDKLPSIQSALRIPEIADALDTAWQSLGSQIQSKIGSDSSICFEVGKTLEQNQNMIHSDAVYALARVVNYSSITSTQATTCLGTYFGPEVAANLKTLNPDLHLGPGYPDIQNLVLFPQVQLDFARVGSAMMGYAANANSKADLDILFEPQVSITDTAAHIFDGATPTQTIEQILDKMKAAAPQYVFYGCQESDNAVVDGVQDTGYFLAIGKDKKPDDVVLLRTWWRYQNGSKPRIYQIFLGFDGSISKALTDYKNVCAYHVTVGAAPEQSQGSTSAQPTPAPQATRPVPATQ